MSEQQQLNEKADLKKLRKAKTLENEYYELQKAQAGSTETVKLSFYHLPYRLFLGSIFLFDIISDLLVIIEMHDNNIKGNKTALLICFIVAFCLMIFMNCRNMKAEHYPANGCFRLLFALFGIFGNFKLKYNNFLINQ